MKRLTLKKALAVLLLVAPAASAGLPEPGARIFGSVAINGVMVTAANSTVVIEARRTPTGPPIASYRMGALEAAGNFYSLKLNAEATAPLASADNTVLGSTLYLVVRDGATQIDQKSIMLATRGTTARVDFGAVDTDGDGMSDEFESLNFGSATGGLANADTDVDGRPNLREFLQGTNPNVADGRHPSDLNPADDRITLRELTDYILAWKTGAAWPVEPALTSPNIEDYVTRAGAIWKGGETYVFDNEPVTTAPLWWVNPPISGLVKPKEKDGGSTVAALETVMVTRSAPVIYRANIPASITVTVTPSEKTSAYAVVETPPVGWTVRNLSHDGRWDESTRKIKWGPFFDQAPRSLTYEAVPGPSSVGVVEFAGRGSFDGSGQVADGSLKMWTTGTVPSPSLVIDANSFLRLQGEAGRRYEVLTSTNLANWSVETTITLGASGNGALGVGSAESSRFYRVRILE